MAPLPKTLSDIYLLYFEHDKIYDYKYYIKHREYYKKAFLYYLIKHYYHSSVYHWNFNSVLGFVTSLPGFVDGKGEFDSSAGPNRKLYFLKKYDLPRYYETGLKWQTRDELMKARILKINGIELKKNHYNEKLSLEDYSFGSYKSGYIYQFHYVKGNAMDCVRL